jgi:hypothetical protein
MHPEAMMDRILTLNTDKHSLIAEREIDIFRPEYMFNKGEFFCRN